MTEHPYHIEIILDDLTKVVFDDGYSPNQPGRTAAEALQELREYRATRQAHDLSVLRHRYTNNHEPVEEAEAPAPKKPKRKVSTA